MAKLSVGLIGFGEVGLVHLATYQAHARHVEVVAIADPSDSARAALPSKSNVRAYEDYRRMIEAEQLDIICVLTPPSLREQIITDCATAKLHVLSEKPMALSRSAAEEIVQACNRNGVKFCYGATYRYLPCFKAARRMIANGMIGQVKLLREELIGGASHEPLPPIHYPEGGPGGSAMGLVDHGVHMIDLFSWLIDSSISTVLGQGNKSGQAPKTEFMKMDFASGASGILTYDDRVHDTFLPHEGVFSEGSGWSLTGDQIRSGEWHKGANCVHIHGSAGALKIYYYANILALNTLEGTRQISISEPPAPVHFATQIDTFARAVLDDCDPPASGEEGIAALNALLAVYESQDTGRKVSLC